MKKASRRRTTRFFAWIAREIIQRVREGPEHCLRTWVRRYGNERGRRMALRAQANGHPLTVENYFRYGEWRSGKGRWSRDCSKNRPCDDTCPKMPWFSAWKGSGLVIYGCFIVRESTGPWWRDSTRFENRCDSNPVEWRQRM